METPEAVFTLQQNYPNPFNPVTTIGYSLPSKMHVTLCIYDVSGAHVVTLVDGVKTMGSHFVQWYGRDTKGRTVPSGIYCLRLVAGDFVQTKKMVLLK
ncbi:MAG: T9SS type A sorting domain-containing protein [bacterium]|nr:MAG: T9SS type A sorting domain-containing protein [bacterium]